MQTREFDHWAKVRERGMLRYVLRSGVVYYGLPMFVIMTYLIPHPRLTTGQSAWFWLMVGAGFGVAMWWVQEHRFRRAGRRY
ncbi:MAG TPA: hypothetical protein VFG49_14990 [Dyella sp.]|uniref:hypothetical protein n=1 Tax=Dyella sp. TaxID=1869338 RepID=UPI002D76F831|nr:hypothetical protein [Dyella sp.]HET6554830.1 hypothetical protein [Dyella sp.]